MRVVFAHDHIFARHAGRYYSPGRLPYAAWRRYLDHFSEVVVLARVRDVEDEHAVATMQRADGPAVTFAGLDPVRGMWRAVAGFGASSRLAGETISAADAVIARVPSEIGLSAAGIARQFNVPLAFEVVASAWHSLWYHGGVLPKVYAPLLEWRTSRALRKSEFALYVTRQYLQRKYPCPGTTASASNVAVAADPGMLERRFTRINVFDGPPIVGFVGSLEAAHKGLNVALHAMRLVTSRGLRLQLHVVGEGAAAQWYEYARRHGIESNVKFLGSLPGSAAVQEWLDLVDVYVHPSRAEGLPRALIEAMSRGCLCFASKVGGIPELLEERYMHPPGDAARLAQLLQQGLVSRDMRMAAARENFNRASEYQSSVLERTRADFFSSLAKRAQASRPNVPN